MRIRLNLSFLSILILPIVFVAACSKNDDGPASGSNLSGTARSRSHIPLAVVQTEAGCLNVPLYSMALRQLRPDIQILDATTAFSLHSIRGGREAFRLLTAFGNFKFDQRSGSDHLDLQGWAQEGCSSLMHTALDGTQEEFRITSSGPDYVLAESDSGGRRSFRWISETRVELVSRHKALDLPCSAATAYPEVKHLIDWGQPLPEYLPSTDLRYVEDSYLAVLASAVGVSESDFYVETPDAGRVQVAAKLLELARLGVRQELLTCNGATPPPTPVPDEPEDPTGPNPVDPEEPLDPEDPGTPDPNELQDA